MMSFEGSYIKLTAGVTLNVAIKNHSNKNITITGFRLICGKTYYSIKYSLEETELPGNMALTYSIPNKTTIYAPIAEFTYRYNSKTYTALAQYNGSF